MESQTILLRSRRMGLFGRKAAAQAAPAHTSSTASDDGLPVFESHSGALWANGHRLHLKGERKERDERVSWPRARAPTSCAWETAARPPGTRTASAPVSLALDCGTPHTHTHTHTHTHSYPPSLHPSPGVNWFGLETADRVLHGLWCRPLDAIMDFVAAHGFNALRLPFSVQLVEELDTVKPTNLGGDNPSLQGLTAGTQLDAVVSAAAKRGILVMLDCHHMEAAPSAIPELWYVPGVWSEERVIKAWQTLARRYARAWNVFAADLNNEPHGRATWGDGNKQTDWRAGAERLGAAVLAANPRLLCFVEGTAGGAVPIQTPEPCFWGGGLCSAVAAPVMLPVPRRLVLSPHVYGPGVFMQVREWNGEDGWRESGWEMGMGVAAATAALLCRCSQH